MATLKVYRQKIKHIMGLGRDLPKEANVRTYFARYSAQIVDHRDVARVTIDMLPDVVLLGIFDFYLDKAAIQAWHNLVHVCRTWRNVVFGSPRRLNLRLCCRARTPVREMLDIWPPLPIVLNVYSTDTWDDGNILAALELNDRICELVIFDIPGSKTEKALATLQRPFPALASLQLEFWLQTSPVFPASFLGGSAPGLRSLTLYSIPLLGLLNLLLTATHLVHLQLQEIPDSGYISVEEMVTALSVLTKLESLYIGFKSPRSSPNWKNQRPPPSTRTLLPALTKLRFNVDGEYLEDLLARIDAPLLDKLETNFFYQLVFDSPQLIQFISRTPKFKTNNEAHVDFSYSDVTVTFPHPFDGAFKLGISSSQSYRQLKSVARVCSSSFIQVLISTVEHLYIQSNCWRPDWQDGIESSQWLDFFAPFTAVTDLYISLDFTPRVAPTLKQLIGERVTEVLPALRALFLEGPLSSGPVQETIEQFVAARQLAGHLISVSRWKIEEN
jgi:hypothetical protein